MSAAPLLCAEALTIAIAGRCLCQELNLALSPGQSLAILGRNGAGKSTLLATLAGLRQSQGGTVRIQGRALPAADGKALARVRGYAPQQAFDPFASTVLETVLAGRHPHLSRWEWESRADKRLAEDALARLGLAGFGPRAMHSLSGGERQRVILAALLAQQPALYLLDEPLAHLDLNHQIAVLDTLAGLAAEGAAVVAVLHDPSLALRYFQQALLLYGEGEWVLGAAADVLTADNLGRLYNHPLRRLDGGSHPVFAPE